MSEVTAIIVTRGDVSLEPVMKALPREWDRIVYDNSGRITIHTTEYPAPTGRTIEISEFFGSKPVPDLSVYGRYAAIEYAETDLIYVQDDDCIVSNPRAIVESWKLQASAGPGKDRRDGAWLGQARHGFLVANQPEEFRHDFYRDHCLVGFGACFHRAAPARAWGLLTAKHGDAGFPTDWAYANFLRTCDVAFTGLTPRVLVDIPKTNLWWAEDESRMYRQPKHVEERARMLELVRKVRDA